MKKILNITLLAAALSISFSCSDELLQNNGVSGESQPTDEFTNAQLEQGALTNEEIPAAFITGIYAQMFQTGTGGTNLNHDDFGQKGYDIYGDMLCGDMALSVSTYGWYRSEITEFQAPLDFTRGRNRMVWRYYYRLVRSANNVIQTLGGNDFTPETDFNKHAMGQALVMRAHSYFYLTQYFQKEYNATEEILPLYIEPIGSNLPKSTASEVYDLMEKDLTDAITLLNGFNRTDKVQVNQDIAKMMLAYVLGAKGGRDAEVATLTQQVINSGNYTMLASGEVTNGFSDYASPSWMWGVDLTETNELDLVSWWGQIDAFSYSYAWAGDYKAIDSDLYAAIPNDDTRKGQFYNVSTSGRYLQPLFKFFASSEIGGTSRTVTADYVYMRIEEAYLLNAEANAKSGAEGAARTSLKALVERRVPDASYIDGLTGQALLDEIYLQTRIELWGEGKSFLAMKRFKATTSRGANHLSFVGEAIPYNDERMQFEIPLDEIQNNPFISNQNQ
ncbi:RagB/SusD family nutrient uptake outer membrane protein [Tenacibaculum sp. FZY0031]|uniref:RagB/SusD family nutrient uptake outer membrane protein n=1 Tax=Tenacibaculum sp. FZY0031 TaxID=3116648 RepID=UPI002EB64FE1|nr:RagB/SusD family nutrient uptake outer membrane protein [Tenacibaculum sp. FZY0031]